MVVLFLSFFSLSQEEEGDANSYADMDMGFRVSCRQAQFSLHVFTIYTLVSMGAKHTFLTGTFPCRLSLVLATALTAS